MLAHDAVLVIFEEILFIQDQFKVFLAVFIGLMIYLHKLEGLSELEGFANDFNDIFI